jgi:hypothetical protein
LFLFYLNSFYSVLPVHVPTSVLTIFAEISLYEKKYFGIYPNDHKSTYENILREAAHRLHEGVIYFLNITDLRCAHKYNFIYARNKTGGLACADIPGIHKPH